MQSASIPKQPKEEFLCPITQEIMLDPVIVSSSGQTYERSAIEKWFSSSSIDPLTRKPASAKELAPNFALKALITNWLKKHPHCSDETFLTALKSKDMDQITRCIQLGANLEVIVVDHGYTPLLWAIDEDQVELAKYLIDSGANIEACTFFDDYIDEDTITSIQGHTPLAVAVLKGNLELVKCLVNKGANLDTRLGEEYDTALIDAVKNGNIEIVKYLVEKGADINIENLNSETPLSVAAIHGNLELIKYFVDRGVNLDNKDTCGYTPLLWAVNRGHIDTALYLISAGADLTIRDDKNQDVEQIAKKFGHDQLATIIQTVTTCVSNVVDSLTSKLQKNDDQLKIYEIKIKQQKTQLESQTKEIQSLRDQIDKLKKQKKSPQENSSIPHFFNRP